MSERLVNVFAAFTSAFLIVVYFYYSIKGRPADINFLFIPLSIIGLTYTMLAIHQFMVARASDVNPFMHPVPFRWVLAIKYASFSLLIWWVFADRFLDMPLEPALRRGVWLQASLVHVWFLRRFVVWDRPSVEESAHARQERQDAQQIVLDETSLVLAQRGQRLSNAGIQLDERIIRLGNDQRVHDAEGVRQDAEHARQDARDVTQDDRERRQGGET